jgi:hypothetical protein
MSLNSLKTVYWNKPTHQLGDVVGGGFQLRPRPVEVTLQTPSLVGEIEETRFKTVTKRHKNIFVLFLANCNRDRQ